MPALSRRPSRMPALSVAILCGVVAGCGGDGRPTATGQGSATGDDAVRSAAQRAGPVAPARPAAQAARPAAPTAGARAWVALEGAGEVAVLRGGSRWRVIRRIPVAAGPHNLTVSRELRLVAVTSPPAGRVTVLRASGRVAARARVAGGPHDVVFVPGRRLLWVTAETAGRLVGVDPLTGRVLRTLRTGAPAHDMAVSPDGRRLWVTLDGRDAVEIRDARTGRLLRTARLGGAPHDLAFEPGGRRVWLSNVRSPLLTIAGAGGRRLASLRAGAEPHHFAFGLGRLWASDNGGGTLLRISPRARRVAGRSALGGAPHHVAVAGDVMLAAVNDRGRVAVVARSGRVIDRVPVGSGPHDLDVLPAAG